MKFPYFVHVLYNFVYVLIQKKRLYFIPVRQKYFLFPLKACSLVCSWAREAFLQRINFKIK